jgi:hypothetical protein
MTPNLLFLVALAAIVAAPAFATEAVVPVPPFHSVGLTGDAHVTIRYGREQRVVLVNGSTDITRIRVDEPRSGSLEIDACPHRCPSSYDPTVEITTPDIEGLAVKGDGTIEVADNFPQRDTMGVAVSGDGSINAERVRADTIHAAVNGDGQITISASRELIAAVNGGGAVRYFGKPHVLSAVHNGGVIEAADIR